MKTFALIVIASALLTRCTITGDIAPKNYDCCGCTNQLKAQAKPAVKATPKK